MICGERQMCREERLEHAARLVVGWWWLTKLVFADVWRLLSAEVEDER